MPKTLRCVGLVLLFAVSGAVLFGQTTRSMYIPANLEWKDSPVTEGIQVAEDAEIFVFKSDHTFAHVSGVMHKNKANGAITLCSGCGFSSEKGSWSDAKPSAVMVRYRLAHSDIKTNGKREWKQETWQLQAASSPLAAKGLRTRTEALVRFRALGDPEVLAAFLRDDN